MDLAQQLKEIALEKGCKPSQLALAWLLAQGSDIVPIPSTKWVTYLEENIGAFGITLTTKDLARIDSVAPPGHCLWNPLSGSVYENNKSITFIDTGNKKINSNSFRIF